MSKILLTGAAGYLGTHMRGWFAARGQAIVATDIRAAADGGDVVIADLSDRAAVDALMQRDIAAVVHLGGHATEAGWQTILDANIAGTYNLFEAARQAGVRRVIYASSYHVVGMYPAEELPLAADVPVRPDSLYGVSKAFGEALARLYFDKFGIECLCIRICTAGDPGTPREARLWCNRDDLAALIAAGLGADELGFRIVYGISDNPNAPLPVETGSNLGWWPAHSSLELGTHDPRAELDPGDPRHQLLGGAFALWGHPDD